MTGYYVALSQGGNTLSSGFTPAAFTLTSGQSYTVTADGYGSCIFDHWAGTGSTSASQSVSISSNTQITAVYNCGGSTSGGTGGGGTGGSGEMGAGPGTVTIYDHRVPQADWAPCFAAVCSAGTGPGVGMWVSLFDSSGNVVGTGFANENGHTFTGLNPSATYYLYPSDCDACHTSTHDVLFNHWGDGTDTRPLAVVASGSFYDAWYICTNTCGGV